MWKFGTITAYPFNWLEASYFYYRPVELNWLGNDPGLYLDKGFNIKFIHRSENKKIPNIAIGFDDFAGTGYFSREYVVSTYEIENIQISLGVGWGKFAAENSFENPLSFFSDTFKNRPRISDNFNLGGSLGYDQWFRGHASLFGGIEYKISKLHGLSLKLELDPFNYMDFSANNRSDAAYEIRKKDSDLNFGLSYALNKNFSIEASFIKGNTFNMSFAFGITFDDRLNTKNKFNPSIEERKDLTITSSSFYDELLKNLNQNNLFLQTASLSKNNDLNVAIATSDHRNAIRSSSYTAFISNKVGELNNINLNIINVSHINAGVELNNISYIGNYLDEENEVPYEVIISNISLDSGNTNNYKVSEFRPKIKFPVLFSSTSPAIVSHVGNPEKFYYGGVNIQNISEIQFRRNILLSTQINYSIYNNITDSVSGPGSSMQHVRSDIVQYLKEDDISISRMQLDYIWSPSKNIYAKLTAGILESMYGGVGGEILFKPFNSNFTFGAELFHVKQRSYDQKFAFLDYQTITGHINLGYFFNNGIETNLSYGRYLAKDDGFTLDIGRRTKSGFKSGIFFTLTDVPADLFGEGSFDKGFYFQIPMDILSKNYNGNYSTVKISPLTRDGGAKLIHDKDLKGLIYNSTYKELKDQFSGFLN